MYSENILLGLVVWFMYSVCIVGIYQCIAESCCVWLERFAGELRQDDGAGHLQLEEGTSGKGALELELAEAREAKERLEGEVRWLQEKLERK